MTKPTVLTSVINDVTGIPTFMESSLRNTLNIVPRDMYEKNQNEFNDQIVAVLTYEDMAYFGNTEENNRRFSKLPNLKVVSTVSAGFDHLDVEHLRNRSIRIGHTPAGVTEATADMAMSLMLAAARKLVPGVAQMMGKEQVER